MKVNKEFEGYQDATKFRDAEVMASGGDLDDAPKASRRMARICATPEEIALYHYNPNGARGNMRPGIPMELENINQDQEGVDPY